MIPLKISSIPDAIPQPLMPKARYLSALLLGFSFMILCLSMCSCSSTRTFQTVPIETIRVDTLYLSSMKYDSIYIDRTSDMDRTRDTITITKTLTEYRYRLLRDTICKTQVDSIPYQVTVTEVKEIAHPLTWYDQLTRSVFWSVCGILCVLFIRFVFNLKKRFTV